jgi:hypothetical protein
MRLESVKQDGTWLFAERNLMVDWTETRLSSPLGQNPDRTKRIMTSQRPGL